MAEYKPVPVEKWGGLNLRDDPAQVALEGAVDLLNVDFDQRGRVRSRDGYSKFTSVAGAFTYSSLASFYRTSTSAAQLLAGAAGRLDALNSSGAIVASDTTLGSDPPFIFARIGTPSAERMYVGNGYAALRKWDGVTWSTPTMTVDGVAGRASPKGAPYPYGLDNRTACTCFSSTGSGPHGAASSPSHVYWSAAGDPETWLTTDFIQLTPGDGESIVGAVSWRGQFFVFKQSKFFVFYGTSTDSTGGAVFNYRTVEGAGMFAPTAQASDAVTSSPHGVYFANEEGIWLTTGGVASLVSLPVQSIFREPVSPFWQGGRLNAVLPAKPVLRWYDNRLYFAYPSTGTTVYNNKLLVHDPAMGTWAEWDIPAAGMSPLRISGATGLMFSYATGTFDIGRHMSGYTQDGGDGSTTGTAITSRYRTGFFTPAGATVPSTIREVLLEGSGTVDVKSSVDYGDLGTASAVSLGVSPAIAQGRAVAANYGRHHSYEFSSTTPWSLNRATFHVESKSPVGKQP